MKLTATNHKRPFSPSYKQHKRINRLQASSPPAAAVQGFPPTGGSISSSSPTAVPTKAQRLIAKEDHDKCSVMRYELSSSTVKGCIKLDSIKNSMPTNKYHVKKAYSTNPEFCSCTVSKRPGVLVAIIIFFFFKGFHGIGRTI